jgi:hypothetical protein
MLQITSFSRVKDDLSKRQKIDRKMSNFEIKIISNVAIFVLSLNESIEEF